MGINTPPRPEKDDGRSNYNTTDWDDNDFDIITFMEDNSTNAILLIGSILLIILNFL